MNYLGIDYGEKRIGLSLADDKTKVASPYQVLENNGIDLVLGALAEICDREEIGEIVVGVPYSLRERTGSVGEQEKNVLDFISRLGMAITITISRQDERFTTAEVDKLMAGKKYNKEWRDAISAMLILQTYLDKQT